MIDSFTLQCMERAEYNHRMDQEHFFYSERNLLLFRGLEANMFIIP